MKVIDVERTKTGLPALWEHGGGATNTGTAAIVCGPNGEPLKPVYVKRRGHLACGCHALFVISPGCYRIYTEHHRRDFSIQIFKITAIQDDSATLEKVAEFSRGEWDNPPPQELEAAVNAAKRKALCYHCREPHFVI